MLCYNIYILHKITREFSILIVKDCTINFVCSSSILLLWSMFKPKIQALKRHTKYLIANACLCSLILILISKWNVWVSLSICVYFSSWSDMMLARSRVYAIGELIDHDDSLDQSHLVFMLILCRSDGQFIAITIQINVFVSQSVSRTCSTNSQLHVVLETVVYLFT